jgi:RHS repeat-associated protein
VITDVAPAASATYGASAGQDCCESPGWTASRHRGRPFGPRQSIVPCNQSACNPDGSIITTAYDLEDRPAQVTQQVSSSSADDRVTQFTYDGEGRILTLVDATSNTAEQHSYTANGQKAWFKDARGYQTSYTYDDLDRLYRTTYPDASFEQFGYDNAGNVTAKTWRDGQVIANTYDALNRLTQMSHAASGRVVTYAYDAASRVTSAGDNSAAIAGVSLPPGVPGVAYTTTYTYDALNRPTGISWDNVSAQAAGASAAVTFQHWYNKARQRTYQTATDNSWWSYPAAVASTVSYSTNSVNQYTQVGSVTPTYTAKGSLSSDGTFTYSYDGWNRLATASGAGNSATYTYDATGRRKSKTVNGTTTVYVTSGDQEVLEYDGSTGQILAWYTYGAGIDEALNRIQPSGARVTLIPDIQGSVIGSLDSASATLAKTAYLPFGESANTSGSYRHTGRRIDAETNGLYYYRARTYSPTLGRFIQPDPIGYAGGVNLYAYVLNDPLNATDPSGEVANFVVGAATSVILGGIIRGISGGNIFDPKAILMDAALGAVGVGVASKAANLVSAARAGSVGIQQTRALGVLGESRLGIANSGKVKIDIGGRVPDRLTATTLDEVKNVALIRTKDAAQIADEAAFAAREGLDMTLWIRPGADVSKVQGLIDSGAIALRNIPGIGSNGFRVLTNTEGALLGGAIGGAVEGASAALSGK